MKRSEAIEVIKNAYNRETDIDTPYMTTIMADIILTSIENAGMLPPERLVRHAGSWPTTAKYSNEWELEETDEATLKNYRERYGQYE